MCYNFQPPDNEKIITQTPNISHSCIQNLHINVVFDSIDTQLPFVAQLDIWYKTCCFLKVWELGQCNRAIIRMCRVISWLGLGKDRSQKAEVHMEVVFFCPSSGGPLAETKWVALSVQSPFNHPVTHSLYHTHSSN